MKNDGNDYPAFPTERADGLVEDGLSQVDYIAVEAMKAILSRPEFDPENPSHRKDVSYLSYEMANAMLRESSK